MQAFFAHRGDLCRICKDLPPRAAVFVQKHNGTRIREAQLFGGEALLCFAKTSISFILLITAPGIRAFSAGRSVGSLSSVCRSASGLHFVKSSGQGRNQARAAVLCEGTKFPENSKKMRFCVFTKPHLWCAGRDSPAPLRTVRPGRDAERPDGLFDSLPELSENNKKRWARCKTPASQKQKRQAEQPAQ